MGTSEGMARRVGAGRWPRGKRRTASWSPWTAAEIKTLQAEWGDVRPRTWRKLLPNRSWCAILQRAKRLGLPFGTPQGQLTIKAAAAHFGYSVPGLRALLARHGVLVERYPFQSSARGERRVHTHVVEIDDVHEALLADQSTEVLATAAHARGVSPCTLRRWLDDAGLLPDAAPERHMRCASADIDRVVAAHRPPGRETLVAACARHGLTRSTLGGWLNDAGFRSPARGAPLLVDPTAVDRVVAAHRRAA